MTIIFNKISKAHNRTSRLNRLNEQKESRDGEMRREHVHCSLSHFKPLRTFTHMLSSGYNVYPVINLSARFENWTHIPQVTQTRLHVKDHVAAGCGNKQLFVNKFNTSCQCCVHVFFSAGLEISYGSFEFDS